MGNLIETNSFYVVLSGRTHLSFKGVYLFTLEEATDLKERYYEKLTDQARKEKDQKKIKEFEYLINTLRIERSVLH